MTISVCMIVKNEEDSLRTCLESLKDIYDELIIVDTGSTDSTKAIAKEYTDKVYDFEWTGSFADARNYSFSKAACDYIYCADADEELDEENIRKFLLLKDNIDERIDIVQMYYCNQLENNTIYNFDRELRPKLYKRIRSFNWIEEIHEEVRLDPVIYNSDIEIIHRPKSVHASRDINAFERMIKEGKSLSGRLIDIYAKELLIAGTKENLTFAKSFFEKLSEMEGQSIDDLKRDFLMATKCNKAAGDERSMFKYALRGVSIEPSSELCYEIGMHFYENEDLEEAKM